MSDKETQVANKTSTVELPNDLISKLERRAATKGFDSLATYTEYILRAVLTELDPIKNTDTFKSDEEAVQNRLESLGYLDE